MTRRCALLCWPAAAPPAPGPSTTAPPGIDPAGYDRAMFEDVAEVLHGMAGVDSLILAPAVRGAEVRSLLWADVPVIEVAEPGILAAVRIASERGYDHAAVVAADAPDLPQLVLAKVFQALARSPVVVAGDPAVIVGVSLPAPAWLPDIDHDQASSRLPAAAPDQGLVERTPGWHRMRRPDDVRRLDPGLEGWEATRALLSRLRSPQEA